MLEMAPSSWTTRRLLKGDLNNLTASNASTANQKPVWLTGTTLWTKKNGNGFQWMDEEDFKDF